MIPRLRVWSEVFGRAVFAGLLAAAVGSCGSSEPITTDSGDTNRCDTTPTWYQDIQPVLHTNCTGCHEPGGMAAFRDWSTYESAQPWASLIASETVARTMPPFIADWTDDCEERYPLLHDMRLDDLTIELISTWAECGAPEGDPATAAALPPRPSLTLEDATHELIPENGFDMAPGDLSICWAMPIPVEWFEGEEEMWLEAVEVVPGDLRVTHHIQITVFPDTSIDASLGTEGFFECTGIGSVGGTDFAGWLPGTRPVEMPEGVAVQVTPESRVTMQIHYHNVEGETIFDKTGLRLRFGEKPLIEPQIYRVGNATTAAQGLLPGPNDVSGVEFRIPAGASGHTEEMVFEVPGPPGAEFSAFMLTNHMHQAGVDMRMWIEHDPATAAPGEPLKECLLATPRYDFGWQSFFYFDAMSGQAPKMRPGDTLRLKCWWDNSVDNEEWMETLEIEGLPPVPFDVFMGASSTDEMCLGMVGVLSVP